MSGYCTLIRALQCAHRPRRLNQTHQPERRHGGHVIAVITQPAGGVMSYKLVRIDRDGQVHWEQTDNRYTLVAGKRMRLRVAWEQPLE